MRHSSTRTLVLAVVALASAGCAPDATAPQLDNTPYRGHLGPSIARASSSWGPETPPFNLEAILRAPAGESGFGLVKFRQPNDTDRIVYLDVSVRHLAPNTDYVLQRAVDVTVDDDCTGTNWLTLGQGTTPRAITTDERGAGSAALSRDLGAFAVGTAFDIDFRVLDAATSAVVLTSECYQFVVTQ
jgi:hypothetical protein